MRIKTLIALIKAEQLRTHGSAGSIRSSTIYRAHCSTDRYVVDFAEDRADWIQFDTDQDAHYFGVWVNRRTLQTLTYAEGDWSLIECPSVLEFNEELESNCQFYGTAPAFTYIDQDHSTVTHVYQGRLELFIPLGV